MLINYTRGSVSGYDQRQSLKPGSGRVIDSLPPRVVSRGSRRARQGPVRSVSGPASDGPIPRIILPLFHRPRPPPPAPLLRRPPLPATPPLTRSLSDRTPPCPR